MTYARTTALKSVPHEVAENVVLDNAHIGGIHGAFGSIRRNYKASPSYGGTASKSSWLHDRNLLDCIRMRGADLSNYPILRVECGTF